VRHRRRTASGNGDGEVAAAAAAAPGLGQRLVAVAKRLVFHFPLFNAVLNQSLNEHVPARFPVSNNHSKDTIVTFSPSKRK
jgi:hypothetical protein